MTLHRPSIVQAVCLCLALYGLTSASKLPTMLGIAAGGALLVIAAHACAKDRWEAATMVAFASTVMVALTLLIRHSARDLVTAFGTPIADGPWDHAVFMLAVAMPYATLSVVAVGTVWALARDADGPLARPH